MQERALRTRQDALVRITRDHLLKQSSLQETLDAITQEACVALDVDRVLATTTPSAGKPLMISRHDRPPHRDDAYSRRPGEPVTDEFMRFAGELLPKLDAKMIVG
jgi:hypothetical protein